MSQLGETQALACGGGRDGVGTKTIISQKFQILVKYNNKQMLTYMTYEDTNNDKTIIFSWSIAMCNAIKH